MYEGCDIVDNKLMVYNEDDELEEITVLSFYHLDEYDHEYAFYTKNEEVGDNIVTYISIIFEDKPGFYRFERIDNEEELGKVQQLIQAEIDGLQS